MIGVAPPKLDTEPAPTERKPVFVRSESIADHDLSPPPAPVPAPLPEPVAAPEASLFAAEPVAQPEAPVVPAPSPLSVEPATTPFPNGPRPGTFAAAINAPVRIAGADLPLWSLLGPILLLVVVLVVVVAVLVGSTGEASAPSAAASGSAVAQKPKPSAAPVPKVPPKPALAKLLEGRAPESLTVSELLELDDARAEKERDAAKALRERLAKEPEAFKDKTVLRDLRKYTDNADTAREALAAMAAASGPQGADLLYEIWTGTQARTDTTELARALLFTRDVRSKASPALSVALDLRQAETCEKNKEILPRALKEADKRALHLLTKLTATKGCGPKKKDDCFQCLRGSDELKSTISAIKTRKTPNPFNP